MGKRYIKLDRPLVPRIIQQAQLSAEAAVGADGKRAKLTRPAGYVTLLYTCFPALSMHRTRTDSLGPPPCNCPAWTTQSPCCYLPRCS